MFRCENTSCKITVQANQPINRIVTKRREKTYSVRKKMRDLSSRGKLSKKKVKMNRTNPQGEIYKSSEGWEIVEEIKVCPKCFKMLTGMQPKLVQSEKKVSYENNPHFKKRNGPKSWDKEHKRRKFKAKSNNKNNESNQQSNKRKPQVEFIKRPPMK